jgi:hypothetical protein
MKSLVHRRITSIKKAHRKPNLKIVIPKRSMSMPIKINSHLTSNTKDSTARKNTYCATCNEHIEVGERITTVKPQNAVAIACGILPYEVEKMVVNHVKDEISTIHHSKCAQTSGAFKTKSGRVSRKPVNIINETFIGGSGFSGCDTYDRGYNRGNFYDDEYLENHKNLNCFVVDDDEPLSSTMLESENETEWISEDDTSDEEINENWN